MSESRATMLASIRRSLGVKGDERIRKAMVEDRLERAPKGVIPDRAQLDAAGKLALMLEKLEAAQASVARLASYADVPGAIAQYLRDNNLPASIRRGEDSRLDGLPWAETALEVSKGPSAGHDLSAVSHADLGVAETGTLVLASGADNPTTLNFLPDYHIVVLSAADVAGDLESLWPKLRRKHGKGAMPRTVNLITGPSRSGDIEQTILLGAHGPRSLHVLVVEG
ncbi:MAG: lactate utilization protein [Proteobacteria bacterium]|nr:lactate utilization protein [Pseudomonadota bacterium]